MSSPIFELRAANWSCVHFECSDIFFFEGFLALGGPRYVPCYLLIYWLKQEHSLFDQPRGILGNEYFAGCLDSLSPASFRPMAGDKRFLSEAFDTTTICIYVASSPVLQN